MIQSMYMDKPECLSQNAEQFIGELIGNNPVGNCPKLYAIIKRVIFFIDRWDGQQRLARSDMYELNDAIDWYEEAMKIVMFEFTTPIGKGAGRQTANQKQAWFDTHWLFTEVQERSTGSQKAAMQELGKLGVRRRWIPPNR